MNGSSPIEERKVEPLPHSSSQPVSPPIETKKELPLSETIQEVGKESFQLPSRSPLEPSKTPLGRIKAAELGSHIETRKLRKMSSFLLEMVGSPSSPSSNPLTESLSLEHHQLGTSSNPVALLRQDRFIPVKLIESELDTPIPLTISADLEKTSKQFNREGVLNNLYLLVARTSEEEDERANALISLIQDLTKRNEQYIDEKTLKGISKTLTQQGIEFGALTRNLEPFIKLSDVKANEFISKAAKEAIKKDQARPIYQRMIEIDQSIVYKGGQENLREILATQKTLIEGYDDVVHLKEAVVTDNFVLLWKSEQLRHPIKSNFLEGYEHISVKDWDSWGTARKDYALELFKTGRISEETSQALINAEQKLSGYGVDPTSVCKLAFYETKINANDFHTQQFMIGPDSHQSGKKRMVSIDEGRWGTPDIAYSYGISIAVTFKNSLITHPDCLKPVPDEFKEFLRNRLKEIDRTADEMTEKGLVCSEEEFKLLEAAYKNVTDTLSAFTRIGKIKDGEIPDLAKKYDIIFDPDTTVNELRSKIEGHLRSKKAELKEKAFVKQSQASLLAEMGREKRMAEYILQNDKATIYGAFERGYPELATFMRVLGRMEPDPGKSLAYTAGQGMLLPRNLASFIQTAKKLDMASDEEIAQMQKDLATLKSNHMTSIMGIALTSNAF